MSDLQRKPPRIVNHSNHDFEPLLDTLEAALLNPSEDFAENGARTGEITGIHIGKLWRFRASDLDKWMHKIAS